MYIGCFLGSGAVTWGPIGSQVGDPSWGIDTGMDSRWKIYLCLDFNDVQPDLNYVVLTMTDHLLWRLHSWDPVLNPQNPLTNQFLSISPLHPQTQGWVTHPREQQRINRLTDQRTNQRTDQQSGL